MDGSISVVHVPDKSRYELRWGDQRIGYASAIPRGDAIVVPHVEVNSEYKGRGLGSRLVREMLDDIRARGLRIVPLCPFVGVFMRRYSAYSDLKA